MDMIAITTIHRAEKPGKDATTTAKAVPPKTEVIAVGATFVATAEEAEELTRLGAAKVVKSAKPAKASAKAVKSEETGSVSDSMV